VGIEHAAQRAQATILRELFGKSRLASLSVKQFDFLGVERDAILGTKGGKAAIQGT